MFQASNICGIAPYNDKEKKKAFESGFSERNNKTCKNPFVEKIEKQQDERLLKERFIVEK